MSALSLIPALPLASAGILFAWRRIPDGLVALLGVGSIAIAAILWATLALGYNGEAHTELAWVWFNVAGFAPRIAFRLDGLSLAMVGVISGVGSMIHAFAAWYMRGDAGYRSFFAYMNLFVAAMLLLVLGDNLLALYFGWEGVGLCSYFLIGFWSHDPANGYAARKAFITTRVGDTFLALGLFLLYREVGTLDIQNAVAQAHEAFAPNSHTVNLICLLILGGAAGKSAQVPLHTWLPDAMAGPTPVSALIHAATMVTAGVYLIARLHGLYELAPSALEVVGWVGAIGLLLAGVTALFQRDIKRILAYSTMSQIAYMFMALGAGAWGAAIFHLMSHAFFKALLFLASGAVILAMHHEQDIFKMGGLRKQLPLAFWSFMVGGAALAAVPVITAGFWSKEAILSGAWASGHQLWWTMGTICAYLTGLYTFRLIFIVFFGEGHHHAENDPAWLKRVPLAVLIVLSTGLSYFLWPHLRHAFEGVLPEKPEEVSQVLEIVASLAGLSGIFTAWLLYGRRPVHDPGPLSGFKALAFRGFDFDALYDALFVNVFMGAARENKGDVGDTIFVGIAGVIERLHEAVVPMQNGRMRWYMLAMAGGLLFVIGVTLWS
jgi:NADH-quinone oxidoreductase subunit L